MITDKTKKRGIAAAIVAAAAWMVVLTAHSCGAAAPQGFQTGGGIVLGGGNGLTKVTTNSAGLLGGSGTTTNPLTATISVSSPVSGTGSSGSPLTSSGDISGVTAGSGLTGGASSGNATVAVNAGSGITADGTSTRIDSGSGLTFSSGSLITNAGSGLTYSSGALITNAGSGMTYVASKLQPSLGTGLAFSGANVIVSLSAASACTTGKGVVSVSASGVATCGDVGFNVYGGTHYESGCEFVGINTTQSTASPICGQYLITSAAGGFNAGQEDTTRFGVAQVTTGASSTGRSTVSTSAQSFNFSLGTLQSRVVLTHPTLSGGGQEYSTIAGFFDATTVDQTDGCYFLYDQNNTAAAPATGAGNSGNLNRWACVCSNNSARTEYVMDGSIVSDASFTTVSAPVVANTYNNLYLTGTTSEVDFYVDNVLSCKITTHIPSGASRGAAQGFQILHNGAGGTARTLNVDFAGWGVDLTSARSP